MTLTMSHGPLSRSRPDTVNYRLEGPEHLLFFDVFPRRVRAVLAGQPVGDTTRGKLLHETGLLSVLYFPETDVRSDLLAATDHATHCPFKGEASYWNVQVGDRIAHNAVWSYREPLDAVGWLKGYMAVEASSMDAWFDEDEQVAALRDPYHRVDVRESSRHVAVRLGNMVVAETQRPKLLSETGLPNRFYFPPEDVDPVLLVPSDTRAVCPYKGTASYWSLLVGDRRVDDAAWGYEDPLENAAKASGHICFLHDELDTEVDGQRVE